MCQSKYVALPVIPASLRTGVALETDNPSFQGGSALQISLFSCPCHLRHERESVGVKLTRSSFLETMYLYDKIRKMCQTLTSLCIVTSRCCKTHERTHRLTTDSHPQRIRTNHEWVSWWQEYEKRSDRSYGLEFIEGLWAEKLALLAIAINVAVIVVSVIWCIRGGNLQTVFTVMSFVITAAAADIALLALYYQVCRRMSRNRSYPEHDELIFRPDHIAYLRGAFRVSSYMCLPSLTCSLLLFYFDNFDMARHA